MDLLQRFEEAGHNGHHLRATTFWSWNDRLDPEEVRRQIREMAKAGLGGYFMHARRGCETLYLGPEWIEAVHASIDEARRTDVTPWLYDEDCWPSGTCSGRVYSGNEPFQGKYLAYDEIDAGRWEPSERTVAVFLARRDDRTQYRDWRLLDDPRRVFGVQLERDQVLLHFVYRTDEYVDVLNREATADFLKRTHELYRQAVGRDFGRLIPGIFTDEPMYGRPGNRVPWSLVLPRFFRRSTGYEVTEHLPELFFPVGPYRKTRFDFYESLTRLFLLAWTMPIHQWCERNGLALTGHVMAEDTLRSQVAHVGAAMPHYEYMQIPGIDHLGRGLGSPVLVKQVSSAAAQLDRPRVLSEMFGCSGWNVRFDDLRWIAEWQFVLGVNLICQHLSALTLRGERKRDFPPSLHCQQPWWPHYYLWNDYAARVLTALEAGKPVVNVLVLHPIASAWAEYSPRDYAAVDRLDERLLALVRAVLGMHADFHFGDELILERHGRVEKGELLVGPCRYGTVIVPDATNLRASTLRLLERFKKSKGRIVFAGRVPECVDGEPSVEPGRLAKGCPRADAATRAGRVRLRKILAPKVEVLTGAGKAASGRLRLKDADAVLAQWRREGDDHVFFFLNTGDRPVKARIRLPAAGTVLRLDAGTGRSWAIPASPGRSPARSSAGRLALDHLFGPRESLLLLVRPEKSLAKAEAAGGGPLVWSAPAAPPKRRKVLGSRWHLLRRDPNALVLDKACWRTDESEYSDLMDIMDIQQTLMRGGTDEMVCLKFQFDCAIRDMEGRRFELVLEQPETQEMWYGGMRTPLNDAGPYWDTALRRVDVTPFVRRGRNVIELRRPWHIGQRKRALLLGLASGWEARTTTPDTELEAVYLTGDFAVALPGGTCKGPRGSRWLIGRPNLIDEPAATGGRDLVRSGYPFFVGRMTLLKDVVLGDEPSPDAVLELPAFDAITATVEVNGQEAGTVWKAPSAVPVGELIGRGTNHIAIVLATSLRNLLGPHHHVDGELHWVGPHSFAGATGRVGRTASANHLYRPEYNVVDFGLGGEVVLRY